jgi:NAD(P)-dependent dehydrogenase (short-subunit alcohol dehydrogenase family)
MSASPTVTESRFEQGAALVIGGSGGIGSAIALTLARAGSHVVLTYHRNEQSAQQVLAQIASLGRQARALPLVIEQIESVKAVIAESLTRFGSLHSVVYASGPALHLQSIADIDPQRWAQVMRVDVNGCFNLVHATLPIMRASQGCYVAVTTAATERVPSRDVQSAAPKAAIEMLMRGVAKEEGKHGVRANCVAPGWIDAGLGHKVLGSELPEAKIEAIKKAIPLRRFGQAQDVADAALYLLSSRAQFVTGQTLAVDGGMQI